MSVTSDSSTENSAVALRTIFTPSPRCLSEYHFYYWLTLGPTTKATDCWPTGWGTVQFFSPGICPRGYSIACSITRSIDTLTETQATCCPSKFVCHSYSDAVLGCTRAANDASEIITITASLTDGSITVYPTSLVEINAYGLSIRYQPSDFNTDASGEPIPPSTAASGSQVTSTSTVASSHHELSSGAKAGIGVGILLSLLFLLAFAYFIFKLRKLKMAHSTAALFATTNPNGPQELGETEVQPIRYELEQIKTEATRHELSSES